MPRLSRLERALRSLLSTAQALGSALMTAMFPPAMSPERTAWESQRSPEFIGGRFDGLTEREAGLLRGTWGMDGGKAWVEMEGHHYVYDGRNWRWRGRAKVGA